MNIKSTIFNVFFIGIFLFVTGRMVIEYLDGTRADVGSIIGIVCLGTISAILVYRFVVNIGKE